MAFSNQYDLIFVRDGTQDIRVFNVATKSEISIEDARYAFTDFALSPSGRYLYAADYGGTNIGYGTPSNPSYVDRFDMVTDTWSVAKAPAIAYQIKVVDDSHVLLQQEDQWINITLNTYNPGSMTQLASVGTFYEGLMQYDPNTGRVYHGNSDDSSNEIDVMTVSGGTSLTHTQGTGIYGTAQGHGGTAVLSTDGSRFYYGNLQVAASNVTQNLNSFPENIYSADANFAFGNGDYYNPSTATLAGSFSYATTVYAQGPNGHDVWAVQTSGSTATLHHYVVQGGVSEPTTFYWNLTAGGSWPSTSDWRPASLPDGANNTADFSTMTLSADATVALNGNHTIGNLTFGDQGAAHNWTVTAGTGGSLTLVSQGVPTINVINQTATLSVVLSGTGGMMKSGNGTLVLAASNVYSGGTTIAAGNLSVSSDSNLGSGPVTITGGELEITGNIVSPRGINLAGHRDHPGRCHGQLHSCRRDHDQRFGRSDEERSGNARSQRCGDNLLWSHRCDGRDPQPGQPCRQRLLGLDRRYGEYRRRQSQPRQRQQRGQLELHGHRGNDDAGRAFRRRQHNLRSGSQSGHPDRRIGHRGRRGRDRHGQWRDRQPQRRHGEHHQPGQRPH